jgi:protein-S-isoprenylcysteine O-methyltransferase Ste14
MGAGLRRRGGAWVAAQFGLIGAAGACAFLPARWPASVADVVRWAGAVLASAGTLVVLAGVAALGHALTPFPAPRDPSTLRSQGAYRFVRHPMYGGGIVLALGWSLIWTPLGFIPTVLLAALFELKSRLEERLLSERFAPYDEYRRNVRWKFVPGIR